MFITLEEAKQKGKAIQDLVPVSDLTETKAAKSHLAKLARCSNYGQIYRHIAKGDLLGVSLQKRTEMRRQKEYVSIYSCEDWLKAYLDDFFQEVEKKS